jgi:hypothetical protein
MDELPVTPRSHRLSLACVLIVLAAVFAALVQSVPNGSNPAVIPAAAVAKPELQPMVQLDIDPPLWGMPDATTWTHMDFSLISLAPGKSFDTTASWYTTAEGPLLLTVLSGKLAMTPAGPAYFYRSGAPQSPEDVAPGTEASLGPGDSIVYSIADTGAGNNPGSEPMLAAIGLIGKEYILTPVAMPTEVRSVDFQYVDDMPVLSTKGATVSIQRLELLPYDSFVFDPDEDWKFLPAFDQFHARGLHMAEGALDGWSPTTETIPVYGSSALIFIVPGPCTLFDLGDEPIDIYFLVLEPYPPPATPSP